MNERIKELIKRATECYSNGQERAFDKEKFAESIVKECMTQINIVRDIPLTNNPNRIKDYDVGFNDGMVVAIRTIKQHFEVE